jgi:hypothetical protein
VTTRRKFIKDFTLGTIALSSSGTMHAFPSKSNSVQESPIRTECPSGGSADCAFDEDLSRLCITAPSFKIDARLSFVSNGVNWTLSKSRDGVPDRFSIVDPSGNVQGYWVVNSEGKRLDILFFHRSAQNFEGVFSLEGKVTFKKDAFACRAHADENERVLNLSNGIVDNRHNDSIFALQGDILLSFSAAELEILSEKDGSFSLRMSGRIHSSAESTFSITQTNDWFKNRYMPYYKAISLKPEHKVPTGWMSWNTYFDTATAEDNLSEARIGKKYLQPFGCDIWHIESWQGNSDKLPVSGFYNMNLEVNEKQFPKGMKQLADDIRALGFIPGIWIAPFGTGSVEFYNEHRNWFLHDKEGKPISSWNGRYTLDPTVPEAREHIKKIHRTAAQEWGYRYFKIDGMSGRSHNYCAHLYERPEIRACFHDPGCPNPFELCVKAIREGIGEDSYLLACQGHSTGPESTYADASRLGADIVHPNKPVVWPNVMNQARCFLNQSFAHNITMICDPDTLLVKDLPVEEARVSATVIALPGQLTFFGDKLAGLDMDKTKILQQTLPAIRVRPASIYPYFDMLPVWNLSVNNSKMPEYQVVALFNWTDKESVISVTTEELGIDSAPRDTYEFWTGVAGSMEDGVLQAPVPAHGVRVFSLHQKQEYPQWIGSDRHISMNALEISDYRWEGNSLSMNIDLVGGFPMTQHFRIPEHVQLSKVRCPGAKIEKTIHDGHLSVTLFSPTTRSVRLELLFRV